MAIRFPFHLVSVLTNPVTEDEKTNNPPSHEDVIPSSETPTQLSTVPQTSTPRHCPISRRWGKMTESSLT